MAGWREPDPVPPGHGEHRVGETPEPRCWCGLTLRIGSERKWCPKHGEYTEPNDREEQDA